jgi:hypothetical protein
MLPEARFLNGKTIILELRDRDEPKAVAIGPARFGSIGLSRE